MSQSNGSNAASGGFLTDLPFGGRRSAVFDRSLNVPANTSRADPAVKTLDVPFDGAIPYVDLSWPDGSQSLAGLQIRSASGFQILPYDEDDGYLSNNDYSARFALNHPVSDGDTIRLVYANLDSTAHKVTVILTMVEADGTR